MWVFTAGGEGGALQGVRGGEGTRDDGGGVIDGSVWNIYLIIYFISHSHLQHNLRINMISH